MSSPPIPAVELWPHQREAITRAVAACGTGKTVIGLGTADTIWHPQRGPQRRGREVAVYPGMSGK